MLGLLTYHTNTRGRVARSQIQINTNKGGARGEIKDFNFMWEKINKQKV